MTGHNQSNRKRICGKNSCEKGAGGRRTCGFYGSGQQKGQKEVKRRRGKCTGYDTRRRASLARADQGAKGL